MNHSEIVFVAATSRAAAVAGAIAHKLRNERRCVVQAVGPAAVNQAVKAVAVARMYLADDGVSIVMTPSFINVEIDGNERTAMRLTVEVSK